MEYQIARLQYFYNKLPFLRKGLYPQFGGNIEFELYTFFEVCYHLKDWIKNSDKGRQYSDLEEYVKKNDALRICGAICNRLKHKKDDNRPDRRDILRGPFELKMTVTVGPNPQMAACSITEANIRTELGLKCCFTLADQCIDAWNNYFITNNINPALTKVLT